MVDWQANVSIGMAVFPLVQVKVIKPCESAHTKVQVVDKTMNLMTDVQGQLGHGDEEHHAHEDVVKKEVKDMISYQGKCLFE